MRPLERWLAIVRPVTVRVCVLVILVDDFDLGLEIELIQDEFDHGVASFEGVDQPSDGTSSDGVHVFEAETEISAVWQ